MSVLCKRSIGFNTSNTLFVKSMNNNIVKFVIRKLLFTIYAPNKVASTTHIQFALKTNATKGLKKFPKKYKKYQAKSKLKTNPKSK